MLQSNARVQAVRTKDEEYMTDMNEHSTCNAWLHGFREIFRWVVIVPTVAAGAVIIPLLIVAATAIGTPIALLVFLGVTPFATIRWAFVRNETWWESWQVCLKSVGD